MKGFGKQVKEIFFSRWSGWIFLVAALQSMIPFFTKSIVLFVTKEALGNLLPLVSELAALLLSGIVLIIPVKKNGGKGIGFWLNGYLPYAAALCMGGLLFKLVGYTTGVLFCILFAAAAIITAGAVVRSICRMVELVTGYKRKRSVGGYVLACIIILLGQYALPYLVGGIFTRLLLIRMVWMVSLLYFLVNAIFLWAASCLTAAFAANGCRRAAEAVPTASAEASIAGAEIQTAEAVSMTSTEAPIAGAEMQTAGTETGAAQAVQAASAEAEAAPGKAAAGGKKKGWRRPVFSAAVIAVATVCSIHITPSLITRFRNAYAGKILQMRTYAGSSDYVAASKVYTELNAELDAWAEVLDENNYYPVETIYREHPDNATIAYLQAAGISDDSDRLEALEKLYLKGNADTDLWYTLLSEYKEADELTGEQENRRLEILSRLAAMRVYTGGYDSMRELKSDRKKLTKTIDEMKELLANEEYIVLMGQMQLGNLTNGGGILVSTGFDDSLRRETFYAAQDNPDDFTKQFLALYVMANADRTVATEGAYFGSEQYTGVVDRFTELLDEKQDEFSEEMLQTLHQLAIKAYMSFMATEKCAAYCEKLMESSDDYSIRLNAMYCYLDSGRPEKCAELAEKLLAEKKADVAGLYYLGAASVVLKDTDTVIDCAEGLAEQLKTTEYPDYVDRYLSQLISEITVYRASNLAEYNLEGCYDDFTDSQLQRIEQNTFLNAYMQAYRAAIDPNGVNRYAEDTDAGFDYIDQMLAVRQDLGYAYYLKGAIYNSRWEDEKAAACFEEAVKYQQDDPMLWYALYDACDAIGEYEKAYYALSVCREFMSWEDYYGSFDNGLPHVGVYRAGLISDLEREHEELFDKMTGEVAR